jgi:hypothetical protein
VRYSDMSLGSDGMVAPLWKAGHHCGSNPQ